MTDPDRKERARKRLVERIEKARAHAQATWHPIIPRDCKDCADVADLLTVMLRAVYMQMAQESDAAAGFPDDPYFVVPRPGETPEELARRERATILNREV